MRRRVAAASAWLAVLLGTVLWPGAPQVEGRGPASVPATSSPVAEVGEDARLAVESWTREDGLTVVLVERQDGLVTFDLMFRSGSMQDPPDRVGLANLTARLGLYGTAALDRAAFDDRLADLAAHLTVSTDESSTTLQGTTLARSADALFGQMIAVVRTPNAREEAFEKARRAVVSELEFDRDNDSLTARRQFATHEFASHPFARWPQGSPASVAGIEHADVVRFRARHWVASNAILAVGGAMDRAQLEALLASTWPPDGREAPGRPEHDAGSIVHDGRRVLLVDRPERSQNQIVIGQRIVAPRASLWPVAEVASAILGGNFSSRLSRDIRAARGWTYSIGTELWRAPDTAALVVTTFAVPDRALEVISAVLEHVERLVGEGASAAEVSAAASYVAGDFALSIDTPQRLASEAGRFEHLGLGAAAVAGYAQRLRALTAEAVNAGLVEVLRPESLSVVMLCTAQLYERRAPQLAGVRSVEVVPYTEASR